MPETKSDDVPDEAKAPSTEVDEYPPGSWYRQFPEDEHEAVMQLLGAAERSGDTLVESPPGVFVNPELYDRVLAAYPI